MIIDKILIGRVKNKLIALLQKRDSESFHSGSGCSCKLCELIDNISDGLQKADEFPQRMRNARDYIESDLAMHLNEQ